MKPQSPVMPSTPCASSHLIAYGRVDGIGRARGGGGGGGGGAAWMRQRSRVVDHPYSSGREDVACASAPGCYAPHHRISEGFATRAAWRHRVSSNGSKPDLSPSPTIASAPRSSHVSSVSPPHRHPVHITMTGSIRMDGTVRHLDELGLNLARHLAGLAHLKREARHNAVEPIRNRRDAAVAVVGRAPPTAPTASRPPHRPFATASRRDRERLVRLGSRVMKKKIERCRHEYGMRTTAAGAAATRDSGERRRR